MIKFTTSNITSQKITLIKWGTANSSTVSKIGVINSWKKVKRWLTLIDYFFYWAIKERIVLSAYYQQCHVRIDLSLRFDSKFPASMSYTFPSSLLFLKLVYFIILLPCTNEDSFYLFNERKIVWQPFPCKRLRLGWWTAGRIRFVHSIRYCIEATCENRQCISDAAM